MSHIKTSKPKNPNNVSSTTLKRFKHSHDILIDEYFNKKIKTLTTTNEKLPGLNHFFTEEKWCDSDLQKIKHDLNAAKSKLSKYDPSTWSWHTDSTEPSKYTVRFLKETIKAELCTQAWGKMYECLVQFDIIPFSILKQSFNSLHLCEAPGSFIAALNHYLTVNHMDLKWNWLANSLNPNYEGTSLKAMVCDERLMYYSKDLWFFGHDQTGDIMSKNYYEDLAEEVHRKQYEGHHKMFQIHLITADGSICCFDDPGRQEENTANLIFCEMVYALNLLSKGGSYVFKMFTILEHTSVAILFILRCCFKSIHIFKPFMSKGGNSEVYVVCINYEKSSEITTAIPTLLKNFKLNEDRSILSKTSIPEDFIQEINKISKFFMEEQVKVIERNVSFYENGLSDEWLNTKKQLRDAYLEYFGIKKISIVNTLVKKKIRSINVSQNNLRDDVLDFSPKRLMAQGGMDIVLKFGKRRKKLLTSKFCARCLIDAWGMENFSLKFIEGTVKKANFANKLPKSCDEFVHISATNSDYSSLEKEMFRELCTAIGKCREKSSIALLGVSFLSFFTAGILHLLCNSFCNVLLYEDGYVLLENASLLIEDLQHKFQNICEALDSNTNVDVELLEIVPREYVLNAKFHEPVLQYNNSLLRLCEKHASNS